VRRLLFGCWTLQLAAGLVEVVPVCWRVCCLLGEVRSSGLLHMLTALAALFLHFRPCCCCANFLCLCSK
jgi:hypothetical protein